TLAAARVLHCSWAHSEAPYHLHEFTRQSLRVLLESLGFQIAWNRADGSSRFLYKLGASGLFDELKRQLKRKGNGYRITAELRPPAAPPAPAHAAAPMPRRKPHLTIRPSSGFAALNLRELWEYRDLLFTLAMRDVKLRYRQTALGVAWVVLQPLLGAFILGFV